MIIFLYGEDTFRSTQKLKEIKEKFIAKSDPTGLNVITFDGDNFDLEKFNNAAAQGGFLVKKRLLIVKNLLSSKPNKELATALAELLVNLKKSDHLLVFWEATVPDQRTQLFKTLAQEKKYTQEFKPLSPELLTKWIMNYVKSQQSTIDNQAIALLISFIGDNLWQFKNELDKLMAFTQEKNITIKEVEELVQAKLDENIFGLVDAIGTNNKPLALKLLNEQLAFGLNEIYILSMVVRQFRILTQLNSLAEQQLSQPQLVQKTKLHPFVVKKLLPVSKKFTLTKLQVIYQKLTELDQKFKSTSLPPTTLLDQFIFQI